jgi:hypothetical protein
LLQLGESGVLIQKQGFSKFRCVWLKSYKSKDLVHWKLHMSAFSEAGRGNSYYPVNSTDFTGPYYVDFNHTYDGVHNGSWDPSWPAGAPPMFDALGHEVGLTRNNINGTILRRMDTPRLYYDANSTSADGRGRVWLSFQASSGPWTLTCENGSSEQVGDDPSNSSDSAVAYATPWVASIGLTDFEQASADGLDGTNSGPTWFATERSYEPQLYTYLNSANNAVQPPDGGVTLSKPIPGSPNWGLSAPCSTDTGTHVMQLAGNRYTFQSAASGTGIPLAATAMTGDSFVFEDDLASPPERWLLYTWRAERISDAGFNGNNVAAFPLESSAIAPKEWNRLFRASAATTSSLTSDLIPIGYRHSELSSGYLSWTQPCTSLTIPSGWPVPSTSGKMFNGFYISSGQMFGITNACTTLSYGPVGVCEGGGAFNYLGRTYVFYSRNNWQSGAYQSLYRKVDRSSGSRFTAAALRDSSGDISWNEKHPDEHVLFRSVGATSSGGPTGGPSAGVNQVFAGPAGQGGARRMYMSMSVRPGFGRTIFFKELHFDSSGDILAVSNTGACDATDWSCFLIPVETNPNCFGQVGDFDHNGHKTISDIFDFFSA